MSQLLIVGGAKPILPRSVPTHCCRSDIVSVSSKLFRMVAFEVFVISPIEICYDPQDPITHLVVVAKLKTAR